MMGFPGSTALANLVLAPIGRHMTARELRIHWVSPAGPIVADFRAGKRTVPGAYCDLWMIPQSSYIPIRIRELGTGNCCSEAKGLPMANPLTRKKRPTLRLGRL
jgi:hypothetical protein